MIIIIKNESRWHDLQFCNNIVLIAEHMKQTSLLVSVLLKLLKSNQMD